MLSLFKIAPKPRVKKVLKPPKSRTKFDNRRYKLHQMVKNLCVLKSKERTIIVSHDFQISNKYIIELQTKFQYNIQTEIFDINNIEIIEPIIVKS